MFPGSPWTRRLGNVFEETRTKLTRLRLNEYNEDGGSGVSTIWALDLECKKQSDKHESCSRLAGWLVHLTCMVYCDVSFPNQKHSKIAQTNFTSDTRYWPNM